MYVYGQDNQESKDFTVHFQNDANGTRYFTQLPRGQLPWWPKPPFVHTMLYKNTLP
jgi:hypothetical protein